MNYEKTLAKLMGRLFHVYRGNRAEKKPDETLIFEGRVYTYEQFEKEIDDRIQAYYKSLGESINRVKK